MQEDNQRMFLRGLPLEVMAEPRGPRLPLQHVSSHTSQSYCALLPCMKTSYVILSEQADSAKISCMVTAVRQTTGAFQPFFVGSWGGCLSWGGGLSTLANRVPPRKKGTHSSFSTSIADEPSDVVASVFHTFNILVDKPTIPFLGLLAGSSL